MTSSRLGGKLTSSKELGTRRIVDDLLIIVQPYELLRHQGALLHQELNCVFNMIAWRFVLQASTILDIPRIVYIDHTCTFSSRDRHGVLQLQD